MTDFWLWMFIVTMLIPIIMVIFGIVFQKRPPKRINSIYGYRTQRSTKNEETWLFSHHYLGKQWFKTGLVLFPVSMIFMLIIYGDQMTRISIMTLSIVFVQTIMLFVSIYKTEKALIKTFYEKA